MKILLLSDANSIHTIRWVEFLTSNNIEIQLFSLFKPEIGSIKRYDKVNVKIISPDLRSNIKNLRRPNLSKIKYLKCIPLLKRAINDFNPDILHAHYASSYGILGLLSGIKPFILSVWGSDIYDFPIKNFINKILMKIVINYASVVCSTSFAMKKIILNEYKRKDIQVVPFGVDLDLYDYRNKNHKNFTVGTIKSIENHNGIENIIEAAKIIIHDFNQKINFLIIGGGTLLERMKQKTKKLNLEKNIHFTGSLDHENAIKYYKFLSIFIAVSKRESFGVSIVEAAASGIPSITSNVGGLTEVNLHNETGIVIDENNPKKLASSIMKLYKDKELIKKLGSNARKHAEKHFNWEDNANQMISIYNQYQ